MGVSIPLAQAAMSGQMASGRPSGNGLSVAAEVRPLTAPATFLPNMGLIATERAEIWSQLSARDKVSALMAGRAADEQLQLGAPVYGRTPSNLTDRTGFAVTAYLGLFDAPPAGASRAPQAAFPEVPKLTQPGFVDVDLAPPVSTGDDAIVAFEMTPDGVLATPMPASQGATGGGTSGFMEMSGPYSAVDRRFPGDIVDYFA